VVDAPRFSDKYLQVRNPWAMGRALIFFSGYPLCCHALFEGTDLKVFLIQVTLQAAQGLKYILLVANSDSSKGLRSSVFTWASCSAHVGMLNSRVASLSSIRDTFLDTVSPIGRICKANLACWPCLSPTSVSYASLDVKFA
jgi:hypothetical protein